MPSDNPNSVPLNDIVTFLDNILESSTTPDYPNALNGLQLSNNGSVTKVAAAVDFSSRVVRSAIVERADLLIVHHGMFWPGLQPIVRQVYSRLGDLFNANIAVYASHLPLDRHSHFGNNVLLAKTLGLVPSGQFALFKDVFIGVRGDANILTSTLVKRAQIFSNLHGGTTVTAGDTYPDRKTRRWAICTGAGAFAETLEEATRENIDTLIVGEGPHWTAVEALERELSVIYVGHYASETLGVYALAEEISQQFHIDHVKIAAPTGL
jgi:dinuclear metal center YbgI/SA1388 family protein